MLSKNDVKFIRSLKVKKYRIRESSFLVEGEKILNEVLHSRYPVRQIYAVHDYLESEAGQWLVGEDRVIPVRKKELDMVTSHTTNERVLAVVGMPEVIPFAADKLSFVLDGINDPGNLGTIIRTLCWFGFDQLFCSPDTVDLYNPKVIAATMGAFVHLNVVYGEVPEFLSGVEGVKLGAGLNGQSIDNYSGKQVSAMVLGSESHGIRPEVEKLLDHTVTIPGSGQMESLNVGVATGILANALFLQLPG